MSWFKKFAVLYLLIVASPLFADALTWKQNPVVYGISPYYLAKDQPVKAFKAIQKRLPEIKDLGANVIWLMPVTVPSEPDHGYNVIDHENVWSELGSDEDLKSLVSEAHESGIKIILDVVLNHSSIHHPFIQKACAKNEGSRVSEFYQSKPLTDAPYSKHFNSAELNGCPTRSFIYYFWPELLNFNYQSSHLRNYMIGTLKKWIRKFNVDGFRFDASWGPSSRWPDFYKVVSSELKKTKKDIALLAEDKAGYPAEYKDSDHPHLEGSSFDWAYDWNNEDPDWISKWSFGGNHEEKTVFNQENPETAADMFMRALSYTKDVQNVKVFRYLENNDTPGFLRHHTKAQMKFAAKTMFLLPGVPLIFYGQEIGSDHAQWHLETFDPARTIKSYNPSLYEFYKGLVTMRRTSPVLSEGTLENLKRVSSTKVSFERRLDDDAIKVILDFKSLSITTKSISQ